MNRECGQEDMQYDVQQIYGTLNHYVSMIIIGELKKKELPGTIIGRFWSIIDFKILISQQQFHVRHRLVGI